MAATSASVSSRRDCGCSPTRPTRPSRWIAWRGAGVAKGTLYLYFPSKEALYLGILSDGLETATHLPSATIHRLPVVERLRRAIEIMIEFYDERRDLLRLIATEEPRLAEARKRLIQEIARSAASISSPH